MSKSLAVEIPDEIYGSLSELSDSGAEKEINREIARLVRTFLEERKRRLNDPIFEPITTQGSGTTDTSECHDRYIYGS